ncbi:MAG: glycoside hydrolase family 95 protein, partial [Clostridia bacterium]|nr:glycoside hydrolase family 95 protein [Clostridia bacterium]
MYVLHYDKPAEDSPEGWEKESLPLGCGYFGVSVFGGVEKERLQFTENSFENDYAAKGLTDAFDVYLSFPHSAPAAY